MQVIDQSSSKDKHALNKKVFNMLSNIFIIKNCIKNY
jgi:hypothetical protein